MKILHVLNSGSWGGAEKMITRIVGLFNKEEIAILCLTGELAAYFEEKGVTVFQVQSLTVLSIVNSYRKFKPDLIHAHDFRATIFVQLGFFKVRTISHIHQNPLWLRKLSLVVSLYDAFFSRNTIYVVVSLGVDLNVKNKIVVPNFVEDSSHLHVADKKLYTLGYFGRLESEKNPLLFIDLVKESVRNIPNLNAIICGKGSYEFELLRRIEDLGLSDVITFQGFVENVSEYYYCTKFLVNTSPREGFGLASVEAGSVGVPSFYVRNSGLREILGDVRGDFEYSSVSEFVEKLKLEKNEKLYKKKSTYFRDNVKRFGIDQAYKNWSAIYFG